MSEDRLPTHLEVAGIMRRVTADGGFATVMRKGDEERGSLLMLIISRGSQVGWLERVLNFDGTYRWARIGAVPPQSSAEITDFLARRTRFDEDLWVIELDIADPERFIAETTSSP